MAKRRRFRRLFIPLPVTVRLLGIGKPSAPIHVEIRDVSRNGLSIEFRISLKNGHLLIEQGEEPIKLIPFIVMNEKLLELDIEMPPRSERLRAKGVVRWYDFGSREEFHYFRAGILMKEMEIEDRKKWEDFIRHAESVEKALKRD
ncbi:MAG: PilZ domain-containing protein [Syntrophaceae bacterium]|nr:PilZ domain-containing protein [Syntrophaceae bacterium]